MTDDEILKLSWEDDMRDYNGYIRTVPFARALLAAGASEGQAEPIYQIRSTNSGTWHDVDKERYYSTRFERRIVYTHDLNNRVLALEASLYLKDEEIAALRLTHEQASKFITALESPAEPNDALKGAMARFRENEIAALRERIAGMEKDAERYRWLKSNVRSGSIGFGEWWISAEDMDELNAAIDAAIAKEPK